VRTIYLKNKKLISGRSIANRMKEYNAPYFPIIWLDDFLKLLKRVRVEKIDRKWVANNSICSETNASKVVTGLKFLRLINNDGNVIEDNLNPLRLEGEPYKTALQKTIKEAYTDLLSKIDIPKAHPVDVLNYFISTYQYSKSQAQAALAFFLHLASQADLEISEELKKRKSAGKSGEGEKYKSTRRPRKRRTDQRKTTEKTSEDSYEIPGAAYENRIILSIKGKGLSHSQEINSANEIEASLSIVKNLIKLKLKKENEEETQQSDE